MMLLRALRGERTHLSSYKFKGKKEKKGFIAQFKTLKSFASTVFFGIISVRLQRKLMLAKATLR